MELIQVDWLEFLLKILAAFLLALPTGWEREQHTRIMGLRTFPLVAVASSAYVLIAVAALPESPQAQARIVQGLITGIAIIISRINFLTLRVMTPLQNNINNRSD